MKSQGFLQSEPSREATTSPGFGECGDVNIEYSGDFEPFGPSGNEGKVKRKVSWWFWYLERRRKTEKTYRWVCFLKDYTKHIIQKPQLSLDGF